MPGNEYRDDHGHFTTEQNDGGPCLHDSSSGKDIIYSDNLIKRSRDLTDSEKKIIEKVNSEIKPEALDVLDSFEPVKIRRENYNGEIDVTC